MGEPLGKRLRQARLKRDLTLMDVAHETRIPIDRIKDLEKDDLSNFANLTYAKSFVSIYSHYLDIDASEELKRFGRPAVSLNGAIAGLGVLEGGPVETAPPPKPRHRPAFASAPRKAASVSTARRQAPPILMGLIVLALIAFIPVLFFMMNKDALLKENASGPQPPVVEGSGKDDGTSPGDERIPIEPPPLPAGGNTVDDDGNAIPRPVIVKKPGDKDAKPKPSGDPSDPDASGERTGDATTERREGSVPAALRFPQA